MTQRIAEFRRKARQSRRIPVAAAFLLLALLACTTYLASAHPIDGRRRLRADWISRAPLTDNTGLVARACLDEGEYVWRDASGTSGRASASPDPRVDITRGALHGYRDATSMSLVKVGCPPGRVRPRTAQVQLALDSDLVPGSGQTDVRRQGDTFVAATPSGSTWSRRASVAATGHARRLVGRRRYARRLRRG